MRALEGALPRARPALLNGTPVPALGVVVGGWAVAVMTLPEALAGVAGIAAAHGALLGTALAWASPHGRRERWAPLEAAFVLGCAAALAHLHPLGTLAYVAVPGWLALRHGAWIDARAWQPAPAVVGGALFGLVLGAHLLINTSLTFGYHVRTGPLAELIDWWAYDLGANVLTAEAFFRGALFERAYRRWSFAPAAALATSAAVLRYLADPLLPHSLAMAAGATFYVAVLGVVNCWLLARTGSLGPALAAAALFFGAYRLLAPR